MTGMEDTMDAVSYTHLDVYKRQADGSLAESIINMKGLGLHVMVADAIPPNPVELDVYKRQEDHGSGLRRCPNGPCCV